MIKNSENNSDGPESSRTILRFTSETGSLEPDCSFWLGFAGDGPGTSSYLAGLQSPKMVLDRALELGMIDSPASIFSQSIDSEHWIVFLTRDLPITEADQTQWVKQLTSLLGKWETPSIGISLPQSIVDNFLLKSPCIHQQLVIKAIHALINTYQIQNFYFYIQGVDSNKATNFLLVLRNLLKTAKIDSTVFH